MTIEGKAVLATGAIAAFLPLLTQSRGALVNNVPVMALAPISTTLGQRQQPEGSNSDSAQDRHP